MEIDDIGFSKESKFRNLLRDLRAAVRSAFRQLSSQALLLDSDFLSENQRKGGTEGLLFWRAVCLGYWLADEIAGWAQTLQPYSMPYLKGGMFLWVDVPAWYGGQAHKRVVDWIRSLERDELWALSVANQMSWIFNEMDPVEAYPVIDADLEGAPGYLTTETRSLDEWERLLSPDTLPEIGLDASVACICASADSIVDSLIPPLAFSENIGANSELSRTIGEIANTVSTVYEAQFPMYEVLSDQLRLIQSRLRPTRAESESRLGRLIGAQTFSSLTETARKNLLIAFQILVDEELASGGAIVWGVSTAIDAEISYRITRRPDFRNVLLVAYNKRYIDGLGDLERALQNAEVAAFVEKLGIDVSRLRDVLNYIFRLRNRAVHGGGVPVTFVEARDSWTTVVEEMRVFNVLQGARQ